MRGTMCRSIRRVSVTIVEAFFGRPPFPRDEPGLEISEIPGAQLFHSDRFVIELAIFHGIVTPGDPTELHLCLSACRLGGPGSMKPNCVASRATAYSILDDVAALAGIKDPEAEPRQLLVPD
jgi:hypothetical protein